MSRPEDYIAIALKALISEFKTDIAIYETPQEAVRGCRYIFGGSSGHMHYDDMQRWRIDKELMAQADDGAFVLAGSNPMHCISVDMDVVDHRRDLFLEQAENRLRVYKRMLHWMFEL